MQFRNLFTIKVFFHFPSVVWCKNMIRDVEDVKSIAES